MYKHVLTLTSFPERFFDSFITYFEEMSYSSDVDTLILVIKFIIMRLYEDGLPLIKHNIISIVPYRVTSS